MISLLFSQPDMAAYSFASPGFSLGVTEIDVVNLFCDGCTRIFNFKAAFNLTSEFPEMPAEFFCGGPPLFF